jgi:hypothetical protein
MREPELGFGGCSELSRIFLFKMMQEAPEAPSALLREYTIPFGMMDLPSLLQYRWVTKVEGIFKVWVIKASLVGDHFASPALLFCVVVWQEAHSDGCRCFLKLT